MRAVGRLFGDKRASLMATDPPYLVDYSGGNHPASRSNRGDPNRNKNWDQYHDPESSVDFYFKFLSAGLEHLVSHSPIYQWHAHRRQALVEEAWTRAGLLVHQQVIWVKARSVLTHSFFLWQHEPCFVGWVQGNMPKRKPPSNVSTVWNVDQRFEQMGVHPTQKPVELFIRPIEYHTEPGEIVYEPFSGSGTQIIAAERTGRVCYAVEQEPTYVDVAVKPAGRRLPVRKPPARPGPLTLRPSKAAPLRRRILMNSAALPPPMRRHYGRIVCCASVAVAAPTGLPSAFPCRGSRC